MNEWKLKCRFDRPLGHQQRARGILRTGAVLHCLLFGQKSSVLSEFRLEGLMKLFDLSGEEDDRKISPYCWRIRLALAHKGLKFASVPWRAEEKDAIAFSGQGQVFNPP